MGGTFNIILIRSSKLVENRIIRNRSKDSKSIKESPSTPQQVQRRKALYTTSFRWKRVTKYSKTVPETNHKSGSLSPK